MRILTSQELLWKSNFGDNYIDRNRHDLRLPHWEKILKKIYINNDFSILEFGANIGVNLDTIKLLHSDVSLFGIEINKKAYQELSKKHTAFESSVIDFVSNRKFELVFTFVFLIHINPNELEKIYKKLYTLSNRYILIAEYFNPFPVVVEYRNEKSALFKRDFAGDLLDLYPDLKLIDHGFFWKRDKVCGEDNINWFLFEK